MRQAQTLNEAQLRRVIQYCRSRRHPTRDKTIIQRWSQDFRPVVKVDQLVKEMTQNDETKEPLA